MSGEGAAPNDRAVDNPTQALARRIRVALGRHNDPEEPLTALVARLAVAFQDRVAPWMQECFGPEISADRVERGDRFLEEVFELLQSGGYDRSRIPALIDYVWSRPAGEPSQEAGGVQVTLAAYCLAHDLDMHAAGETELARILQPEIVEKIRAKQAAKARDIPFSPLPQTDIADGPQWRPIESAPKDGSYFLIWRPDQWDHETTHVACWDKDQLDDGYWSIHDGKHWHVLRGDEPTHWCRLPAPPVIPSVGATA